MSLGLNYPNASDKIISQKTDPGGDIYIHGSCVTVGCIPIQDFQIEEVYILAMGAKWLILIKPLRTKQMFNSLLPN